MIPHGIRCLVPHGPTDRSVEEWVNSVSPTHRQAHLDEPLKVARLPNPESLARQVEGLGCLTTGWACGACGPRECRLVWFQACLTARGLPGLLPPQRPALWNMEEQIRRFLTESEYGNQYRMDEYFLSSEVFTATFPGGLTLRGQNYAWGTASGGVVLTAWLRSVTSRRACVTIDPRVLPEPPKKSKNGFTPCGVAACTARMRKAAAQTSDISAQD